MPELSPSLPGRPPADLPPFERAALEERLGYVFSRPEPLITALTHSSLLNERPQILEHNERLEFLGDAVLNLAIATALFKRFPQAREGELTSMRSRLVSATFLAARAREIGLGRLVLLGRGEEIQGGRDRNSMLADVLEAVLAAVYEDGGFGAACAAVEAIFSPYWLKDATETRGTKNFKTLLQEKTLQIFGDRPIYIRQASSGPDHLKIFEIVLRLPDGREFTGNGKNCKRAEQDAARQAFHALEEKD